MSGFSGSSGRNRYRNGNYGSGHYKKKGFFGNLFSMGSGGSGRGYYNQGQPYQNQQAPDRQGLFENAVACKKCNAQIPVGSKFCLECGEKVADALFCMNCGEKLPPQAKFCLKCGTKL